MFDIAGTVELGTICPGTGTWNRLQDGITGPLTCSRLLLGVHGIDALLQACSTRFLRLCLGTTRNVCGRKNLYLSPA